MDKKTAFSLHCKKGSSKNERTFCLNKRLPCYIALEIFVTRRIFFIILTWKLVDQDLYSQFPMSLDWHFEYAILGQIQNSDLQECAVIMDICLFLMLYDSSDMRFDGIDTIASYNQSRAMYCNLSLGKFNF